ncbi:MAG: methyltransferase domain-containing protein [Candidatus Electrothrix scaldis]|nr:MAG: methyltransferase domain-containing protein [Candidatus Electrothrix sp. GW3-3]
MDDQKKWLELISNKEEIILELGCGEKKSIDGVIGIDKLSLPGVDFIADINKGLGFIPDNSIIKIYSKHFLEHIDDISYLFSEIARVLKSGGIIEGWVPHWSNPYYYSDPTHKTFFGLYTFSYFTKNEIYKRKVPNFYQDNNLILEKNLLLFRPNKGDPSFFSRVLMKVINFNSHTQEIYEKYFAKLFFVDEIYFQLRRT